MNTCALVFFIESIVGCVANARFIVTVGPAATPVYVSVAVLVAAGANAVGPSVRNARPSAVASALGNDAFVVETTSIFGFWKYCVVLFLIESVTVSVEPDSTAVVPARSRFAGGVGIASVLFA